MDLIVEKLEEFGLEEFIDVYRFHLCTKTVSPHGVAVALKFDSDQCAAVNHPLDNFTKCEKLYELIQKRVNVGKFLEALNETGNEHILEFMKEADFSIASTSANPNRSQDRGIWFNIPEPINSFCGREDFLSQLHDQLKPRDDSEPEVTVFSQVKIVSGLGGIGKTQTAQKYIMKYRHFYNNFIWIDAETENSLRNSFLKLAEQIQIPIKNSDGKSREIQEIVKEIYNKICEGGKSNLIVFDNAEDYQSCRQFLPILAHPKMKKPVILATSRNQDWISPTGKIQVLTLDKMTEYESLEFIWEQLQIPMSEIPEFCEGSKEFIELMGGLPLALQQAVAYIKQQRKVNEPLGRPFKLSDYVKEFKSGADKLQKFPHAPDSSTTVFITWNLTLEKIKKDPKGRIAIELIELMSFLHADNIPIDFLLQLLLLPPPPQNWMNRFFNLFQQQHEDFQPTESDLAEGLKLLEKFSIIKITGNFLSVHRQVQFVIMQNLKGSGRLIKFFNNLIKKCLVIFKNLKLSECSDIFLNLHQIVNNSFDLIPVTEEFLDFMDEFGHALNEASRYSESLDLYKKVYSKRLDLLGENHQKTLIAQHQMAMQIYQLGRYDEALILYKEVLEKQEIHFGIDHPEAVTTKHSIAQVLLGQEKYHESLEMFQQVLAQKIKTLGENDSSTLSTQSMIALLHSNLRKFSETVDMYQYLEMKQTELLGPDHRYVLLAQYNKATVLLKMGKLQEASKIFQHVYEKQKETLGENDLETINTLESIAMTLEKQGKFTEALDIFKMVYAARKTNLGQDHPRTIRVQSNIVNVECKVIGATTPLFTSLDSDNDTGSYTFQCPTPRHQKVQEQGSLLSAELKPNDEKREPFSSIVGRFVYDSELAIKTKIKISLNFLCKETVSPVQFAMDLLSLELLDDNRFHELMRLDEGDFTLCYYLYVEILKLTSLDSLRKALEALNATENEHIVKYILFGEVADVEQRQDTDDSWTSALNWTIAATENVDVSQTGAERGSYNLQNLRVLFINQKFDARGKFSDKNYLEKRRDGADVDDVYMEQTFKQKPTVKFEVEENVTSEEISGILNKFKRKCVDDGNDGFALFISTHGGKEPYSLLMDDLKWIHYERDVVQKFSRAEFPAFSGKRKIFHFNAYQSQTSAGETSEEPQFLASSIIDSDILVGLSNQPRLFSHPGNADHPASN